MDRFTLGVGLLALVGIGVVAQGGDSPGVDRPLRILPPDESRYEPNLGFYHSWGGGQFLLQNPIHDIYTGGLLPPPLGMTQIHSFQSAAGGTFVYPGGSMPVSIFPAPVSVRVTCSSETPTTGTFQTEMLQLDLTAPGGVMIRTVRLWFLLHDRRSSDANSAPILRCEPSICILRGARR